MRTLLGAIAGISLLVACNDDGRDLADPPPTSSTLPSDEETSDPGLTDDASDTALALTLSSPAFDQGGEIDVTYTCEGDNRLPPLTFSGVPAGAVELAITVIDEDANGFVHLAMAGLPASTTGVDADSIPDGAVFATTDAGFEGWTGPCPPAGDDPHAYEFTLHAFAEPLGMQSGLDGRQAVDVISQTAMASSSLTAFYASS